MPVRRGYLLVEALCALALAGVLVVACASAVLTARRATASAEVRARAERAGTEALQVVAGLLRDADSVRLLADTAVEFELRIAEGVICARDAGSVTFPPAAAASGLFSAVQPPEPGDLLRTALLDGTGGVLEWTAAPIDSVTVRSGGAACGAPGVWVSVADQGRPSVRAVAAVSGAISPGSPARVGRRGRVAIYESAGEWMVGWRRCANGACGVVQPLAGPVRRPSEGGFQVVDLGGGTLRLRVRVPGIAGPLETLVGRTDAGR